MIRPIPGKKFKLFPMNEKIAIEDAVTRQLSNLLLDLKKDTSVKGVHKQITDAIRSVTQDYQRYTITKRLKKVCEDNRIQIPDIISQSERQYWSRALKNTKYDKINLVNNTFISIEHFVEIRTIKNHLLNNWRVPKEEKKAIEELKEYFKENVICFFKLTKEDAKLKPGENFNNIREELVQPDAIRMKI